MSVARSILRWALVGAAAATLGACVTVFPETKAAQLYRFGAPAPAPTEAAAEAPAQIPPVGIFKWRTTFARAVASDRILTVHGPKAAYIADARWVSPASVLFDEALGQAFDDNSGPARLVVRGEVTRAAYQMRLDVRDFEAVYDHGPRAAPTVLVRVRAVLTRTGDRSLAGDETFTVRVKAASNRVGAIVDAFDDAAGQAIGKLVAWTNETAVPPEA